MKILIIGGTGLISTAITQFLVERGDAVTLFNRGQNAQPVPAAVRVIQGDRTRYADFENQMAAAGRFDVVMEMVGYAPADGDSLVRAFAGQVGQLIFCSTVDVYRKPAFRYPVLESEPYGGLNPYSLNKITIEKTLLDAQQQGAFPLTIIRPAYTYGEGRGPLYILGGRLGLVDRLRRGLPVVLAGDGSSLWTCCHRDDVARAFVSAAGHPATFGKSYHTPGDDWMTWTLYLQRLAQAAGAPEPKVVNIPTDLLVRLAPERAYNLATNFRFHNIFDASAARADLQFRCTLSWLEGARRLVAWQDAHGQLERSDQDPFLDHLIAAWQQAGADLVSQFGPTAAA